MSNVDFIVLAVLLAVDLFTPTIKLSTWHVAEFASYVT